MICSYMEARYLGGYCLRVRRAPSYFTAHWDDFTTHERDGAVRFNGTTWLSKNGRYVSMPYAVVDDFGNLVPLPVEHWPSL